MPYRVLLFDLFGTIVLFKRSLADPPRTDGTMPIMDWLRDPVRENLPGIVFDEFVKAVLEVTRDIIETRPPEYLEVLSEDRFSRVLTKLGVDTSEGAGIADRLCRAHMGHLSSHAEMPPEHGELLSQWAKTYQIGLISNFDHGPTAHAILAREGIASLFGVTLISADFGRRKPHPAIFEEALNRLGAERSATLYVGDTIGDDVRGAAAANLDVVWINRQNHPLPQGAPKPTFTISDFKDLPRVLGQA